MLLSDVCFVFKNSLVSAFLRRVRDGVGSFKCTFERALTGSLLKSHPPAGEYVMGTVSPRAEGKTVPGSPWMLEEEGVGDKGRGGLYLRGSSENVRASGFLSLTCPVTLAWSRHRN